MGWDIKKELEISQETYRNYMLQMKTLINQKRIEVPGAKKNQASDFGNFSYKYAKG
jgi:hypothetical protein